MGKRDHIIEWLKPKRKPVWMTQEAYDRLPLTVTVREFAVGGTVYLTTLLNKTDYPKKELAELYSERWKVELDFRSLKTDLNMEMLRCKSPEMAEKEVAVRFIAYNLIRANIAESSAIHFKIARQVSFKSAVQILDAARTSFGNLGFKILKNAYVAIAKAIVSTRIGKRKRPSQPRAVKRRPKAYPLLTIPRSEACYRANSNKF